MKLATLKDGTRDGQLAVVARDLKSAHLADGIAPTLQAALDDWAFIAPQLDELSRQLNSGRGHRCFDFDPKNCMAPLPRAFQWVAAAAYPAELARGEQAPASTEVLMYRGAGDAFLGPADPIEVAHAQWGIDFEAGLAVISDDVPMGATPDQAMARIKLLMLVNGVALRNLMPDELARGYGFLQSRPAPAFSPLAVTPDELGEAWKGGKVHLPLRSTWNGKLVGQVHAGVDMASNFPQLLAHLARARPVRAGSIVGSGAVANLDARRGYSSIAGKRCLETGANGAPLTPFMQFGDTIRIDMAGADGKSIFGAIEQSVLQSMGKKVL